MASETVWTWWAETAVTALDDGLWQIDLGFQGRPRVVAAYLLEGEGELALIETGPSTTLSHLLAGIRLAGVDPAALTHALVTHIHLDHAGAAGLLVRECPRVTIHVHPFGLPHLADPARLVSSASRIYGDQMAPLWGEVAPVPESRLVPYRDGEVLTVAGRALEVLFTPGHAWHHVALWDPVREVVFTGDVAGIRMPGYTYVCPPTPPPDLDPQAWKSSIQRLQALDARRLYLTHFGPFDDVAEHLDRLTTNLDEFFATGEDSFQAGESQDALTARLHTRMAADLESSDPEVLANYELATPSYMAAMGLARYFTKRAEQASTA